MLPADQQVHKYRVDGYQRLDEGHQRDEQAGCQVPGTVLRGATQATAGHREGAAYQGGQPSSGDGSALVSEGESEALEIYGGCAVCNFT